MKMKYKAGEFDSMEEDKKPSRRLQRRATKDNQPWWLKQLRDRPLTSIGTAVSGFGGSILLLFFCQLGRIPELDLAGASSILMAVAVVGFAMVAGVTGCSFGAGLMLRDQVHQLSKGKLLGKFLLLGAPGILSVLAFAIYSWFWPEGKLSKWAWSAPIVLMFISSAAYALLVPPPDREEHNRRWAKTQRAAEFIAAGYFWLMTSMSAWLTFIAVFPRDGENSTFLIGVVLWTIWCLCVNAFVALAKNVHVLAVTGGSMATSLFVLLWTTGNWAGLPRAIVSTLGLGEVPAAIVLSSDGCEQLNKAAGGTPVCKVTPGEKSALVCPAILRSRIGAPVFIGLSAYDSNRRWPQTNPPTRLQAIAIPKSEMLSWSQLAPMKAASASSPTPPTTPVSYLDVADKGAWLREQCGAPPTTISGTALTNGLPK